MAANERKVLGVILLLVVNVVWVASAEVTKYLFVDLNFKRPFFTTYIKSCLFSVFLLRYLLCGPQPVDQQSDSVAYDKLEFNPQSDCDSSYEDELLTPAEFEPVHFPSDLDSEIDNPDVSNAEGRTAETAEDPLFAHPRGSLEARAARLPYRPPAIDCDFKLSPAVKYTLYFAPLWVLSSATYQAALVYSSVSSVNLISASSSLFVLVFGALMSSHSPDRFSLDETPPRRREPSGRWLSFHQFSTSIIGASLSFVSAMIYAIYLVVFSVMSRRTGSVDMNLMFGVIGLFSFVVCTPLLAILHHTGVEPQLPLPTNEEMLLILFNSLIGSIFSDYLWLYACTLTSGLVASISLTLTIPLSIVADVVIQRELPDLPQCLAAIPIMTAGFKLVPPKRRAHDVAFSSGAESAKLMTDQDDLEI
ncbi:Solute carrier family 35 member F5 [Aphelenchoides fujianensis]|nr:Solute carrier family 35 member F5 [Aphelenchoides fujianensis]